MSGKSVNSDGRTTTTSRDTMLSRPTVDIVHTIFKDIGVVFSDINPHPWSENNSQPGGCIIENFTNDIDATINYLISNVGTKQDYIVENTQEIKSIEEPQNCNEIVLGLNDHLPKYANAMKNNPNGKYKILCMPNWTEIANADFVNCALQKKLDNNCSIRLLIPTDIEKLFKDVSSHDATENHRVTSHEFKLVNDYLVKYESTIDSSIGTQEDPRYSVHVITQINLSKTTPKQNDLIDIKKIIPTRSSYADGRVTTYAEAYLEEKRLNNSRDSTGQGRSAFSAASQQSNLRNDVGRISTVYSQNESPLTTPRGGKSKRRRRSIKACKKKRKTRRKYRK